jgi:hypothetical protein
MSAVTIRPDSNRISIDYSCEVTIAMDSVKDINNPKGYTIFGLSHTSHFLPERKSWLNVFNSVIRVP